MKLRLLAVCLVATVMTACSPTTGPSDVVPTPLAEGFSSVGIGEYHACGVDTGGGLWCWGQGLFGQTGRGSVTDAPTPVPVPLGDEKFVDVASGSMHSCALSAAGDVWCWGGNFAGQAGQGSTADVTMPHRVTVDGGPVVQIAVSRSLSCARTRAGAVWCWGDNGIHQLSKDDVPSFAVPVQLTEGPTESLGVWSGGVCFLQTALRCTGKDRRSWVLDGVIRTGEHILEGLPLREPENPTQQQVPGRSLFAGNDIFGCQAMDQQLWCWGAPPPGTAVNQWVPLAVGRYGNWTEPYEVPDTTVAGVAASSSGLCVLRTSGQVGCSYMRAESPLDPVFVPVDLPEPVVSLSGGQSAFCVASASGRAWCWGDNSHGQLGGSPIGNVGEGISLAEVNSSRVPAS